MLSLMEKVKIAQDLTEIELQKVKIAQDLTEIQLLNS